MERDAVASGFADMVRVPSHPLIKHWVSVLRDEETPCAAFRTAMAELGRLLIYEASRDWLPLVNRKIQTPMAVATAEFVNLNHPILIVPILRAGLALAEHASSVLPATKTYHLGMCRDETTLKPSVYLNKLPDKFPEGAQILLVDPMLATGGTVVAAIELLNDRGVVNKQITLISAIVAPPALQKLSNRFPGLSVYTAVIDPILNEKGFIVPGLGDAGDRSFDT
ncbi:uracil phosphoribosyltransferase-like [Zingiber officinale]|uniref:uracil phosphoribosyltransferase-like n=1 Tax=Zingiber officinale TaxID=94328 RepID=UPI001C4C5948|nr:uracil phosphoribosyltransferase-like [Zingiber officinale]